MVKYLFIAILCFSNLAGAQAEDDSSSPVSAEVRTTHRRKFKFWQLGPRLLTWQETVDAKDGHTPLDYRARFLALGLGVSQKASMGTSTRWFYNYSGDVFYGNVKAASETGSNVLDSQSFFGAQLSAGILYRSANNTMFGFHLPVFYRNVKWSTGRSSLALGQESLVSVGLGMTYHWRVNKSDFIVAGFTYRPGSAMWTIGYDFKK